MPKKPTKAMLGKTITELNEKVLTEKLSTEGDADELSARILAEVEVYDTDEKQLSSGCWNVLNAIEGMEIKTAEPAEATSKKTSKKGTSKKAAGKKAASGGGEGGTSKKTPAKTKEKTPAKPKEKKLSREEAVCKVILATVKKAGASIDEIASKANDAIIASGGKDNIKQSQHITRCFVRGCGNYFGIVEEVSKGQFRNTSG